MAFGNACTISIGTGLFLSSSRSCSEGPYLERESAADLECSLVYYEWLRCRYCDLSAPTVDRECVYLRTLTNEEHVM